MEQPGSGILRIGTSNVVVPGNKQSFPVEYQQKSRLHYYSTFFNTVELNSTFYKIPLLKTFEKWSLDVPENFEFTIKLWRDITHAKNLDVSLATVDTFLKAASGMGSKSGCLLVQFPGKINLDYYTKVEQLLLRIQQQDHERQWRKAVEFRSDTWYVSETYELLDACNASLVVHDIPKGKNAQPRKKENFVYTRYHGPAGDYKGSYSIPFLREQANKINNWLHAGKDVYAYFNNTIGNALENALTLQSLCGAVV